MCIRDRFPIGLKATKFTRQTDDRHGNRNRTLLHCKRASVISKIISIAAQESTVTVCRGYLTPKQKSFQLLSKLSVANVYSCRKDDGRWCHQCGSLVFHTQCSISLSVKLHNQKFTKNVSTLLLSIPLQGQVSTVMELVLKH